MEAATDSSNFNISIIRDFYQTAHSRFAIWKKGQRSVPVFRSSGLVRCGEIDFGVPVRDLRRVEGGLFSAISEETGGVVFGRLGPSPAMIKVANFVFEWMSRRGIFRNRLSDMELGYQHGFVRIFYNAWQVAHCAAFGVREDGRVVQLNRSSANSGKLVPIAELPEKYDNPQCIVAKGLTVFVLDSDGRLWLFGMDAPQMHQDIQPSEPLCVSDVYGILSRAVRRIFCAEYTCPDSTFHSEFLIVDRRGELWALRTSKGLTSLSARLGVHDPHDAIGTGVPGTLFVKDARGTLQFASERIEAPVPILFAFPQLAPTKQQELRISRLREQHRESEARTRREQDRKTQHKLGKYRKVYCRDGFTALLTKSGEVEVFGRFAKDLGLGKKIIKRLRIANTSRGGSSTVFAISSDGVIWKCECSLQNMASPQNYSAICGVTHPKELQAAFLVVVVQRCGRVAGFGFHDNQKLESAVRNPKIICVFMYFAFAISEDGQQVIRLLGGQQTICVANKNATQAVARSLTIGASGLTIIRANDVKEKSKVRAAIAGAGHGYSAIMITRAGRVFCVCSCSATSAKLKYEVAQEFYESRSLPSFDISLNRAKKNIVLLENARRARSVAVAKHGIVIVDFRGNLQCAGYNAERALPGVMPGEHIERL